MRQPFKRACVSKKAILTSRVQGLLDRMESFRTAVIQFDGDLSDGYYQIRDLNTFCNDLISDHSSDFCEG